MDPTTAQKATSCLRLRVKRWNAWLPGVAGPQACADWAKGAVDLRLDQAPDVSAVPPMLRRRLNNVGRLAAAVMWDLIPESTLMPMVFCSQHGDQGRTIQLLGELGQGQPLSPAAFSMSVHNSVAGVLSIAKQAKGPITALAADEQLLSMGMVEAFGLLQSNAEVLLVVYDLPLPEVYQQPDLVHFPYAIALVLSLSEGKSIGLELAASGSSSAESLFEPEAISWLRWFADEDLNTPLMSAGKRQQRMWLK